MYSVIKRFPSWDHEIFNFPLKSTPEHPVHIVPGGSHCPDLIMGNGLVNPVTQAVIDAEIAQMKIWGKEYYVVRN